MKSTMDKEKKQKISLKKILLDYVLTGIAFVSLIVLSFITKQKFIKLLPCLVTLFVQLLDSKVNRFGKLIGAANCIIYSIGYFEDGLYGNAFSALLYSMPIQIITFILWSKNKFKQGTIVRSYTTPHRINLSWVVVASAFISIYVIKMLPNSNFPTIQGILFGVGFVYSILAMFGYIEWIYLAIPSSMLSLGLYIYIVATINPTNITYVIIGTYTLIRMVVGIFNWHKMYKDQAILNGGHYLKDYEKYQPITQ